MTPKLPPELLRKVVEHIKENKTDCGRLLSPTALTEQTQLYDLLSVSKDFKNLAVAPTLYRDCLVSRAEEFQTIIKTAPGQFDITDRIRFALEAIPYYDLYHSLLEGRDGLAWSQLHTRHSPQDKPKPSLLGLASEALTYDETSCMMVNQRAEGLRVLGKMRRVCMGFRPNEMWEKMAQTYDREDIGMTLPLFLIDHPPVEHYCQSEIFGPFALPHSLLKVANPPKVVTHHVPVDHLRTQPTCPPAIVLGTLNRYYFGSTGMHLSVPDDDLFCGLPNLMTVEGGLIELTECQPTLKQALPMFEHSIRSVRSQPREPYQRMLTALTQDGNTTPFSRQPIVSSWIKGTKVELYGLIRCYTLTTEELLAFGRGQWDESTACQGKAFPLDRVQSVLDDMLDPIWRGKVILKNREDAPPCTACDMDLSDQWEKTTRHLGTYVPAEVAGERTTGWMAPFYIPA